MKEKLIEILETFTPDNVYLQGTLNPDEAYPQKFTTFFTNGSEFNSYYDDNSHRINWSGSVMFYSDDPAEVLTYPPRIIIALRDNGFIPTSAGYDIISDVQTHSGFAMDFIYPEKYSN